MPQGPPTKFTAHHLQPPATRPTKQTNRSREKAVRNWGGRWGRTGGLVLFFLLLKTYFPQNCFFTNLNLSSSASSSSSMASSLSSKPFLGSSRTEGFSGLTSLSTDLSKLSFSAVKISVGSRNAKKLRMFCFIFFCITCLLPSSNGGVFCWGFRLLIDY